ncbi:MAG UNVERIFIED_CONTAM: DUF1549 domain-containing protein [Planctomycetaceae bacterium]
MLLASPDYADFFAGKWTALLKNRRDDASDITSNFAFHAWVRDSFLANKPYNQFVRELLAATGTVIANPPVAWYKRVREPKQQQEDVAQLFLGCACSVLSAITTPLNAGARMTTTDSPRSFRRSDASPRALAVRI